MKKILFWLILCVPLALTGCASALLKAVRAGDVPKVNTLLEQGAKVDDAGAGSRDYTPLMQAAKQGNVEIAATLLDKGANVNATAQIGGGIKVMALTYGAMSGNPKMVPFLISKGADVDAGLESLRAAAADPILSSPGWYFEQAAQAVRTIEALTGRSGSTSSSAARKTTRKTGLMSSASGSSSGVGLFGGKGAAKKSGNSSMEEDDWMPSEADLQGSQNEQAKQSPEPQARQTKTETPPAPSYHSDVDSPKYKAQENPNNYALVVGVEKYLDLPDAQFAERDAEAVREHLIALGYPSRNVAVLTGQKATKTGLVKNLETWLPNNVSEQSTVFFYYSGHGAPDVNTAQAYLVPVDGDPQYLADTGYPVKRLYEKLNALKVKRVIVALDSCFSGAGGRSVLPKGARPLMTKVDTGSIGTGKVVALTASNGNQISGTLEDQGHGLFTYYLLNGLNGAAKDEGGRVTLQSLYDYLVPKVEDAAKRSNRDQTPQLMPAGIGSQASIKLR